MQREELSSGYYRLKIKNDPVPAESDHIAEVFRSVFEAPEENLPADILRRLTDEDLNRN
jgi:hypothetical protein